jgi:hypothetical protein
MKIPSIRELLAAPELALVPPLLTAVDATLASLRAQHSTLDHEQLYGDPGSLRAARACAAELTRARRALLAYDRAARRALSDPADELDDQLPF